MICLLMCWTITFILWHIAPGNPVNWKIMYCGNIALGISTKGKIGIVHVLTSHLLDPSLGSFILGPENYIYR